MRNDPRLRSVLLVLVAAIVLAACGGNDDSTSKADAKDKPAASKGSDPTPGSTYEGDVSDGSKVTVNVDGDGGTAVKIGYVLNCDGKDLPQEADLGPFPVEHGEIDAPAPGGDGSLEFSGLFDGDKVAGSLSSDAYDDEKLGACDAVDLRWRAELAGENAKAADDASSDGDIIEAGHEILKSDFEDDADGWKTANTSDMYAGLEAGGLRFNLRKRGISAVPATAAGLVPVEDVVVTTNATFRVSANPKDAVGISCRHDRSVGYNLYVSRDGWVGIFREAEDGSLERLDHGQLDEPLHLGTQFEMSAVCAGDKLQLIVDGHLVASATEDDPLPTGGIALLVSGEAKTDVLFHDAVAAEPKG